EKLVEREVRDAGLDVPERNVHGGDRRHGHGPAAPVRAAVEELPRVLDAVGVSPYEHRGDMVAQVGGDGELASVEGRITEADDAVVRGDPHRDERPAGARDEHLDLAD